MYVISKNSYSPADKPHKNITNSQLPFYQKNIGKDKEEKSGQAQNR
jgi:hypothetical protein